MTTHIPTGPASFGDSDDHGPGPGDLDGPGAGAGVGGDVGGGVVGLSDAALEVMCTDAVLAGRAMSSAVYLAGLLAAGELETAGTPRKLPADMWPEVDPAVVQAIWDRAAATAWRAAQFAQAPWPHRETLAALQARFAEAGFHAMGGVAGRARELAVRSRHPVDGEIGRSHE